ncbi:hypothetical protein ACFWIP_21190, partial [Streptomyces anulatus]
RGPGGGGARGGAAGGGAAPPPPPAPPPAAPGPRAAAMVRGGALVEPVPEERPALDDAHGRFVVALHERGWLPDD